MCTKKRKAKLLGWCSFFSRKKLLFKFWHSIKRLQSLEYVPPTWDIIYANRLELVSFYWSFWAMSWDPLQRIEKSSFLPTVNLCTKKLLSKVRSQLLAFLATSVFSSGHKFQWWVLHKFSQSVSEWQSLPHNVQKTKCPSGPSQTMCHTGGLGSASVLTAKTILICSIEGAASVAKCKIA